MFVRTLKLCSAVMFAVALTAASPAVTRAGDDGVVRVKSAYPIGETIARLKKDIAGQGHQVLQRDRPVEARRGRRNQAAAVGAADLRQSAARNAIHHRQANAGLDWPVRLLVFEDEKGAVWTAYTDFDWIARRHGIESRKDQFKMASTVINSITSSVKAK